MKVVHERRRTGEPEHRKPRLKHRNGTSHARYQMLVRRHQRGERRRDQHRAGDVGAIAADAWARPPEQAPQAERGDGEQQQRRVEREYALGQGRPRACLSDGSTRGRTRMPSCRAPLPRWNSPTRKPKIFVACAEVRQIEHDERSRRPASGSLPVPAAVDRRSQDEHGEDISIKRRAAERYAGEKRSFPSPPREARGMTQATRDRIDMPVCPANSQIGSGCQDVEQDARRRQARARATACIIAPIATTSSKATIAAFMTLTSSSYPRDEIEDDLRPAADRSSCA